MRAQREWACRQPLQLRGLQSALRPVPSRLQRWATHWSLSLRLALHLRLQGSAARRQLRGYCWALRLPCPLLGAGCPLHEGCRHAASQHQLQGRVLLMAQNHSRAWARPRGTRRPRPQALNVLHALHALGGVHTLHAHRARARDRTVQAQ